MAPAAEAQFLFTGVVNEATICPHCGKSSLEDPLSQEFDFEVPYKLFPRRIEKMVGIDRLKKLIKTKQDYEDFIKAVKNYALEVKDCLPPYIKRWPTFIGTKHCQPWRDYVEVEQKPSGIVED